MMSADNYRSEHIFAPYGDYYLFIFCSVIRTVFAAVG